jgi:membrane-bound lytic murein transglycosylase D
MIQIFPLRAMCRLCLLLPLVVLFGCAVPKKIDDSKRYYVDEEEFMVAYTPRDDGQPLTPAELLAFKTVTAFDRHLSEEDKRIVELQFKLFVHQNRRSFERFLERSARFLPHVRKEFANRGIPDELVYIFMIESGGNPNARSHAGAVGLWQFMPRTGRHYRLFQNAWIDERRDPYKATTAAADYLLKLYNDFGDWHLVAAAYNAGEGKIGRAMRGTGARGFFELCRLNDNLDHRTQIRNETRDYVPRLIAVAKIMRNLERLGFSEPDPALAWDLRPLTLPPSTNLTALARHLDLSWDEFSGMNPAFRRTASPPNMNTTAYVPPDKLAKAIAFVESREARVAQEGRTHTIQSGDTLNSIARRHGVTVAAIREANGFEHLPSIGAVIIIPGRAASPAGPGDLAGTNYTVRPGDTLSGLARQWGVSVNAIRAENGMAPNATNLRAGQRLIIPGSARTAPAAQPRRESAAPATAAGSSAVSGQTYTVQQGDTPFSIARRFGVTVEALSQANNLNRERPMVRVGQRLVIPGAGTGARQTTAASGAVPSTPRNVTVQAGDTLSSIARNNGVSVGALQKANNMGSSTNLRIGQRLVIP